MKTVVVISDTHRNVAPLSQISQVLSECDIIVHLGDMASDARELMRTYPEKTYVLAGNNDFFGGNLNGIREKLPYLQQLGVSVVYLNPIFQAFSNHRYDTGDFKKIDPLLGTLEDFDALVRDAAAHGIRIILDGVFNHTGDDSLYFNKYGRYPSIGAYQSKESPYAEWYRFIHFPDRYECW